MTAYAQAIGATPALPTNTGEMDRLPQDYADMLGCEEVQAWAVEEERDLTVHVATKPRQTLQELWPSLAGRN